MARIAFFSAVAVVTAAALFAPATGQQPPAHNAAQPAGESLLLVNLPPGQHYLRVTVNAAGVSSADVVRPIRVGERPTSPAPGKFGAKVATWLATVNATAAEKSKVSEGLAAAYRAIAGQIDSGRITTPAQAAAAAKQARQMVYDTLSQDADEWASFDESLAGEFQGLMAAGELAEVGSVGAVFKELANGLSANSSGALSPEIIQLIVRLVLQIIERLLAG